MDNSSLDNLKQLLEKQIPIFLSKDSLSLQTNDNSFNTPLHTKCILIIRGSEKEFTLGQIWSVLKYQAEGVEQKYRDVNIRDKVYVKKYFFGENKKARFDKRLFVEPPKVSLKRKRKDEEGMEIEEFEPKQKRRKMGDEEEEAKRKFIGFVDEMVQNKEEKRDFKSYRDLDTQTFEYEDEFYRPYYDYSSVDELKKNSIDIMPTDLVIRGGMYSRINDFRNISDLFSKIHGEEKYLEKMDRKYRKKTKRKAKDKKKISSTEKAMDEFGIHPLGYQGGEEGEIGDNPEKKKKEKKKKRKKVSSNLARRKVHNPAYDNLEHHQLGKRVEPIIIVSGQLSSLLTIYNVKSFLQDSQFISTEDIKRSLGPNTFKEKMIKIVHTNKNNKTTTYRILDNPRYIHKRDWKNVVAVFTNGKEYEFKYYPKEFFNPEKDIGGVAYTKLFNRIKGFHLCYSNNSNIEPNIRRWPITILKISQSKDQRHQDYTATTKFWKLISKD